ncbi:hypothetical protein L917_03662 [Phytophthora nicotianae]|uniref:Uncharacterized protein n=1 Tax=Phytophthora nicotianae TaxID=4792 RepID=W2LS30_PHYNI|nr:hypothetical protein L917_03662 [Phytophthora nicotianae]
MLRSAIPKTASDALAVTTDLVKPPPLISLDMYIAFREEFASGWNLWLGDEEVATLSPEQKQEMPYLSFDEKAANFFRLSLWSNKKNASGAQSITDVPDGAEIFVERVTGLSLFENKLAQGNTSRVEVVTKVDDVDSEHGESGHNVVIDSQSTGGSLMSQENNESQPEKEPKDASPGPPNDSQITGNNLTEHDHISPNVNKKRRREKITEDATKCQEKTDHLLVALPPKRTRTAKKMENE